MNQHFMPLDARTLARVLGGEATGNNVRAPGPGHSRDDRSMSVLVDPKAPDGFVAHSFANDAWESLRDYINEKLGRPAWSSSDTAEDIIARMTAHARAGFDFNAASRQRQEEPESKSFNDRRLTSAGYRQVAAYDYLTEDGELLYQVLRYEHPTKDKTFLQRRPDGRGGWLSGAGSRKVLYRWPDLPATIHNRAYVCEGEKDADRLAAHGFLAVTVANGGWTSEAVEALRGYDCFVLEDNDASGREKAANAATMLHGVADSVRVVRLPGLPEKGDVSDWLDAGNDYNELPHIADKTPVWTPRGDEREDSATHSEPPQDGASSPVKAIPLQWHGDADPNEDRAWLIRDLIPETGKGLMSGQWGSGKTFGALDLSASVMTMEAFAGRRVNRQGGVLFIAPEGAYEIPIRLRGIVEGKLQGLTFLHTGTDAKPIDPGRLPIAWIDECPPLVGKDSVEILTLTAQAAAERMEETFGLPLALIVVDTVAASAGVMDENAAAENHRVMNALETLSRKIGAFVLGVDHFGKMVETGTRGSSAKEAAADVVLAMLADRDVSGTISNTRMAVRKLRGGATGAETPYSLEVIRLGDNKHGESVTTCIVRWDPERSSAPAGTTRERWPTSLRVFQKAMQLALTDHGKRIRPFGIEGPEVLGVAETKVRAEFVAAYPVDGETSEKRSEAKKKAFSRALKNALERELVISRDLAGVDHLWLKDSGDE
ncbi:AAA family ATPase [Microvirga aerophila]|uniref:Toprim domain-containing protein n=1 Tax=Microvirga aerophila TaxID=670291 RepID=A0A512BZQ1_9HYPH|nr:AAA family ATPase [Microvirga aerophila]GEO17431.1 hypothetical protein MAE02_51270 [Microvirga aerophila]